MRSRVLESGLGSESRNFYSVFVRCVSVFLSVCVCARSGPVNQTSLKWEFNANSSKTVKDMDFKFHKHVPRDNPYMNP